MWVRLQDFGRDRGVAVDGVWTKGGWIVDSGAGDVGAHEAV